MLHLHTNQGACNSMKTETRKRPFLKIKRRAWAHQDGTTTPGLVLHQAGKVYAHLTPEEARTLADKLHDYADHLEQEVPR